MAVAADNDDDDGDQQQDDTHRDSDGDDHGQVYVLRSGHWERAKKGSRRKARGEVESVTTHPKVHPETMVTVSTCLHGNQRPSRTFSYASKGR